jgi:aryl-alcohol dehydrogenase-like predicted oxidoreductase
MEYRNIPQTPLKVSAIALGTWVFGGTNWGPTNEKVLRAAVDAAIDHGVNLIDTAPVYGHGKSEQIIGRAIQHKRDQVLIATKCGLVGKGKQTRHNLSRGSILQEIDASLKRLRTDYIDLYQCHWPDPDTPLEETLRALNDLQASGKIRYVGISNFGPDLVDQAIASRSVVSYQGQYSLFEHALSGTIFPRLREAEIGFLAYGCLGGGILTGKYDQTSRFRTSDARSFFYPFYGRSSDQKSQKRQALLAFLRRYNRPLNQIALNWVRQTPGVSSVLVGCRTPEQVRQNVGTVDWTLTDEEINAINQRVLSHR